MGSPKRFATRIVNETLDEAESKRSLAIAADRNVLRMLRSRSHAADAVVEPFPRMFARRSHWELLSPVERHVYAVRACAQQHPDWTFSHFSAAAMHGLFVSGDLLAALHIASAYRRNGRLFVHRTCLSDDVVTVDGIRVAPLPQTVIECTAATDFPRGLPIADSGVAALGMPPEELARIASARLRGKAGASRAAFAISRADRRSESGGESFARAIMIEEGFALPDLQAEIPDPLDADKLHRVDFLWRSPDDRTVVGEFDRSLKYLDPRFMGGRPIEKILLDERERESRLGAAGVIVVRFKYRDVADRVRFARLLENAGVPRASPLRRRSSGR